MKFPDGEPGNTYEPGQSGIQTKRWEGASLHLVSLRVLLGS